MIEKEEGFGLVKMLRDPRLSMKSKGLLTYLYKCPEGTDVTVEYIRNDTCDGRIAITSAINECIEAGYLEKFRTRHPNGNLGEYKWILKI